MTGRKAITTRSPCQLGKCIESHSNKERKVRAMHVMVRSMARDGVSSDTLDILVANGRAGGYPWLDRTVVRRIINGYK